MISKVVNTNEELEDVLVLLKKSRLPFEDIALHGNLFIRYHDESGYLIGAGGLEWYGSYALIRSIVVDEMQRGKSVGKKIITDLLLRAKSKSIKEIYLLTETAHDFFIKLGFKDVSREQIPAEVKASSEFTLVCPASAACMTYKL